MSTVGLPRETRPDERRVSLVPDVVPRLLDAGLDVLVQPGAGRHAYFDDDAYRTKGARVSDANVVAESDVVVTVQALSPGRAATLRPGAITIGFLPPDAEAELLPALRDRRATAFSVERVPRISRAQAMDVLSSQAMVAGYRAALTCAERLPRFFPLFMTAAGTVPPAKVLVLGAGVAGLSAIATARRLGALVEAYDVRAAAAEEVRSLGASFLELELETQEGSGGYARVQSEEFLRGQRELLTDRLAEVDAVITTAAVPGRRAPVLLTQEMIEVMRPGSVVVDLPADSGGNCELSRPGEEVRHGDVVIWGGRNVASTMPVHASELYARNITSLLLHMTRDDGKVEPDFRDEIVSACCLVRDGEPYTGGEEAGEEAEGTGDQEGRGGD